MLNMRNVLFAITILALSSTTYAADQNMDLNYKEIDKIEDVLETNFPKLETPSEAQKPTVSTPQTNRQKADFSGVGSTALYSDLAVIQKTYMPKSGRAQLSAGLVTVPTDVFYLTGGVALKADYHFSETWGLEVFTNLITSSSKEEISNISNTQGASVKNLVSLKNYSGANLYYNFIYGKLSLMDKKVLPFEIFNTVGVGSMINSNDYQSAAVQVGLGTLLSLSRSSAIRLDLNWAFYQTKNIMDQTTNENSTFFSAGYSWFFPEPQYR